MFKGVLFDLDGVIVDTAPLHFLAWQKIALSLNIKIDKEFNENLKGVSRHDSFQKILDYGNIELSETDFQKYLKIKNDYYLSLIDEMDETYILPGALDLIKKLKANNFKIALASASMNGPLILKKIKLIKYFDSIIDPSKIKEGKPSPQIFIAAYESLNLKNNEVIGIEDAKMGIEALKSAHVFAVGVGDLKKLKMANCVYKSLDEFEFEKILLKKGLYE